MANETLSGFEEFCGGVFWDQSLTFDGSQPDFTSCFENSVLVWVPCGFLWLVLPFYSCYLHSTRGHTIPINRLNTSKTVIGVLLVLVSLLDMIKALGERTNGQDTPLILVISPLILACTLLVATVLVQVERVKCFITSGILFIFWFMLFIAGIVPFYTKILHSQQEGEIDDLFRFITFFVYFTIITIELILSCIADQHVVPTRDPKKKPCPETQSSFLSRLVFWWINELCFTGYRKSLTQDDLWELHPRDVTALNAPIFQKAWEEELLTSRGMPVVADPKPKMRARSSQYSQVRMDADERTPLIDGSAATIDVKVKKPEQKREASLMWVLAKCYGSTLIQAHLCKLVYDLLTFLGPILQNLLISYTENTEEQQWKGYIYAFSFFLSGIVSSIFFHQLFHIGMTLGMRIKSSVIAAVYKKALTMSNEARKDVTVGEIVNLMSVDAQRLQDVTGYLWMVWSSPLQIAIAVYMLWDIVGASVLAGLAIMILLIPINGVLATMQRKLQIAQMTQKDQRIKLMNEVLNGMKVLKLYAWELSFRDKISAIRNMELETLRKYAYLSAVGTFTWTCAPFLVTLATFTTFVVSGHELDATTAFVSLSLFNILRFPINLLPMMISYIVTASVSIKRLGKFLQHGDIDFSNVNYDQNASDPISIERGTFSWGTGEEDLTILHNVNMKVKDNGLVAVVGTVGCGKSSLVSAILGEMEKIEGKVTVRGSVAYVPQQAWIQNATLRENIIFGKPFDKQKYEKVLEACALKPDLEILPGGDMVEIGEKGINLSGGQKQRISLARAVYNDADIYLLDDPLSAVDSHVGKHIFDEVVGEKGVLKNKTRLLVTHGLHWLPKVDKILVITDGAISESGTYDELLSHNGAFAQFLKTYLLNDLREEGEEEDPDLAEVKTQILQRMESIHDPDMAPLLRQLSSPSATTATSDKSGSESQSDGSAARKRRLSRRKSSISSPNRKTSRQKSVTQAPATEDTKAGEKLIQEEKSETGEVKWTVFMTYIKALGLIYTILLVIFFLLYQAASVLSNVWLSAWTEDDLLKNASVPVNSSQYINRRDMYLGVYGGLGGVQAAFVLVYAIITAISMVRASRELHSKMLLNILRSPMAFFDTTPIGRILNRFSRDIETVDNILPQMLRSWMNTFFTVISTIIVISYSTPIFLSVVLPVGILYYFIQRFYIPTSRQLKRLESTTRSPIYTHFSETITGASTIRAYKEQTRFVYKSDELVDHNLVFYFSSIASNRWLGFRLEFIGSGIVLMAAMFAVIGRGTVSGGLVGLSISYALQVTQSLNWMVRMTSDLETNVVSVERVKEYSETPQESAWYIDQTKPPRSWPSEGKVAFENYMTRYRPELDLVLRGITVNIGAGEKVGIVGRTGAGKSSLTLSLFRIIEASGGSILIDGIEVAHLGLHQLRGKLTILPQDPVLFSGSLRMNLDPFDKYSDNHLWAALDLSHLREFVESLPAGLNYECGEGGQNLSVGQRQLVCLARTLLRKTKILILDEATAAVDLETDELIQNTIRTEFSECTILTIAHRLNTIMDNDRVMVLDTGKIAEFDSPTNLLRDRKSIFYGMAKDAGLV